MATVRKCRGKICLAFLSRVSLLILEKQAFFLNSIFTLPRQPIKSRESDKSLITVESYSINISEKKNSISNFHFSHYKSIETISCHSNQSSYPTGIKTQLLKRAMSYASIPSFSFILLTVSEEKNFEYFSKIYPLCRPVNQ